MKNKITAIVVAATLGTAQLLGSFGAYHVFAKNEKAFEIRSEDDFYEVVKRASDASWSEGMKVILKSDLDLKDFVSIPYFNGEFDGGGHYIKGVRVRDNISKSGLIAETGSSAQIYDLRVEGSVKPGGSQKNVGGIVGENHGTISGCEYHGEVSGDSSVGAIAGSNASGGSIISCLSYGSVEGTTCVGGVTGENRGIVRSCTNNAMINRSAHDETISGDRLNSLIDNLTTRGSEGSSLAQNTDTIADIGGIAGFSHGKIESCYNVADVGYQYVGYNIGGIAGRSSGYISSSVNRGQVLGRKDAGGIVGQLVPHLAVDASKDDVKNLRKELGKLHDLINGAADDMSNYSGSSSSTVEALTKSLEDAEKQAKKITDGTMDYADNLTGQWNGNMKSLGKAAKDMEKTLKNFQKELNGLEKATDNLVKNMDDFRDTAKMSAEDKKSVNDAIDTIQSGMSSISSNGDKLASAMRDLVADLEKFQKDKDASGWDVAKVVTYTVAVLRDFSEINTYVTKIFNSVNNDMLPAAGDLLAIVEKYASAASEKSKNVRAALSSFNTAAGELSDALSKTGSIVLVGDEIAALMDATTELTTAVEGLLEATEISDADRKSMKADIDKINAATKDIKEYNTKLQSASAQLNKDIDTIADDLDKSKGSFTAMEKDLEKIGADLRSILNYSSLIMNDVNDKLIPAMNTLTDIAQKYADATDGTYVWESIKVEQATISSMSDTLSQIATIIGNLTDGLDTDISLLDNKTRQSGDAMYKSMLDANSNVNRLAKVLGEGTSVISGDVKAISDQLEYCINLFIDTVDANSQVDLDPLERIEDKSIGELSEKQIAKAYYGHITGCDNTGDVSAAMNTGGIAGNVGIESELSPEDDLQGSVSLTAKQTLQSKCIIDKCKNDAAIFSRRNNVGGICGLMDLGLIQTCENYGSLSSENGGYVGGMAGYSASAIRNSFAKCDLAGASHIGGVAGYGTIISQNNTMVRITRADQAYGAIAGELEDRSADKVYKNYFVAEDTSVLDSDLRPGVIAGATSGIGGVSFPDMAKEISYEKMLKKKGLPKRFSVITLTFEAGDEVVDVKELSYGESLSDSEIPAIPPKDSCSAKWDRSQFSDIKGDDRIRAIYSVRITTAGSDMKRDDKQAALLAVGDFSDESVLSVEGKDVSGDELERLGVSLGVSGKCEYRYLPEASFGKVMLYMEKDGKSEKLEYGTFGKYLVFESDEQNFDLVVMPRITSSEKAVLILIVVLILAAGVAAVILLKKRKRKTPDLTVDA